MVRLVRALAVGLFAAWLAAGSGVASAQNTIAPQDCYFSTTGGVQTGCQGSGSAALNAWVALASTQFDDLSCTACTYRVDWTYTVKTAPPTIPLGSSGTGVANESYQRSYYRPPGTCNATGAVWATTSTGCSPGFGSASTNVDKSVGISHAVQCPAGSTATSNVCTCNAGSVPNASLTACQQPCTAGLEKSSGYYDVGTSAATQPQLTACAGNCKVAYDGYSVVGSGIVAGVKHYYVKGSYFSTGDVCDISASLPALPAGTDSTPADSCGAGEAVGSVNGNFTCVKQDGTGTSKGSDPIEGSKKDTTVVHNPDGTTTTTQKETTTKTDGNGGSTTGTKTTVTTCDSAGNCSESSTEEGAQEDDPKDECEGHEDEVKCAKLGDAPEAEAIAKWNVQLAITPDGGWQASGACPADRVLSLHHGLSVTFSFSKYCEFGDMVHPIVLGVAWLSAALLFVGMSRKG